MIQNPDVIFRKLMSDSEGYRLDFSLNKFELEKIREFISDEWLKVIEKHFNNDIFSTVLGN